MAATTSHDEVDEHSRPQTQSGVSNSTLPSIPSTSEPEPPVKRFRLLAQDTFSRPQLTTAPGINIDGEIASYESYMTCLSQSQTAESGLKFWIDRQSSYPLLAPLAQDLLASPASQAYVEKVFSVCGDFTSGKRNRLTKKLKSLPENEQEIL